MSKPAIPEALEGFIRQEAEKTGFDLVNMSTKGGANLFLEIVLDKSGGINLEECSDFNRKVSSWIDEQGMFNGRYTVDVCSPGLDRELKSDNEFIWAVGKQVKVTTHEPVEGSNSIVGRLIKAGDGNEIIVEKKDGVKMNITRDNITKANLSI